MVAIVCEFVDGKLEKKESNEQKVLMLQDLVGRCKDMGQKKPEDDKVEKDIEIIEIETQESEEASANV